MVGRLTHVEAAELLAPLALDALEANERAAVEGHAEACGACRAELADHREVASLLTEGWLAAPDGVWDRITAALDDAPPPYELAPVVPLQPTRTGSIGPAPAPTPAPPRRSPVVPIRGRRPWIGVAAAMVAAAAAVGVVGFSLDRARPEPTEVVALTADAALRQAAAVAARDPDSRRVSLESEDGDLFARAVLAADGTGYLLDSNLPALPDDRTYQLWAVVGEETVSVGVLGPSPEDVVFSADGPIGALAITEEAAGGVVRTRNTPLVVGLLTA